MMHLLMYIIKNVNGKAIRNIYMSKARCRFESIKKLKELNENPEYRKRIESCCRDQGVDAMRKVEKVFCLNITCMEVKRFGLRQQEIL